MQPDLEERLERIDTSAPKDTSNDRLTVVNIDVDCSEDSYDNIRVSERYRDMESGRILTQFKEVPLHFNHATGFQVRWSGQPFTILPGQSRVWPRYLAEHFAYHLCNHMLDKLGPNHRTNPLERPAMLKRIIIKEEPEFGVEPDSVGAATLKQVEKMNAEAPDAPTTELGAGLSFNHGGAKSKTLDETEQIARDPLRHVDSEVPVDTLEVIKNLQPDSAAENGDIPEAFKGTPKAELVQSIRNMDPGYKFPPNPSKAQLVSALKKIAGV